MFAIRDVSDERRLDQVKSDFVATVSHELRTPLTSIYGFAETLLRADTTFGEDDRATFVRYIATEAERLTRLVDGLLSATRLEAGSRSSSRSGPVDVPGARARGRRPRRAGAPTGTGQARRPAAPGLRAGRPGSRAAGADQPRRQRDQVLAGRRRGEGAGARTGQPRRGARVGSGHRHLGARPAQPLPQVLPASTPPSAAASAASGSDCSSCAASSPRWAGASGSSPSSARARRSSSSCPPPSRRQRQPRTPSVSHSCHRCTYWSSMTSPRSGCSAA